MGPKKFLEIKSRISNFVLMNKNKNAYEFSMSIGGENTLYSSIFAVMILHYCGVLNSLSTTEREAWASYINSFQDPIDGVYRAPEIFQGDLSSGVHDAEHLSLHLICHILPALELLGSKPRFDPIFARKFIDEKYLMSWLSERNWELAWLEGNNLLFVGQLLDYFREAGDREANGALELLMDWLDKEVDPQTGLWGTNGFCDKYTAMYGGYHQLILYYYLRKPVNYPEKLIDTVLSTQHIDGGYSLWHGGGTCQDVDAVDILVNLYKLVDYRRREIRRSLRRAESAVLRRLTSEGGFEDRVGHDFIHMGMEMTRTPGSKANMFSTWFGLHTLSLISEVLKYDHSIEDRNKIDSLLAYNTTCSMGWHRPGNLVSHNRSHFMERCVDCLSVASQEFIVGAYRLKTKVSGVTKIS